MKKTLFVLILLGISNTCFAVSDFYLRKGDTGPYYYAQIIDSNGTAVNLAGATITCSMKSLTGTAKVTNATVTITDNPNGYIEYHWTSTDTDWATTFYLEFKVTVGGLNYTFPSHGLAKVIISENFTY